MILERVKAILVEELDLEEDTITLDSRIKDDLGADSLDLFELINKIEDELDVTIEEEDYGKLITVGDIVNYLAEKIINTERDAGRRFLLIKRRLMIYTKICEMLKIKYPIFQGGMAQISDSGLAAAVSQAGGLGIIASGNNPPEAIRDEIHKIRELTDKPFGVNVMLLSPYAEEVSQMLIEEKVPVIVTGAGNPGKYMKRWKEAGIKVIPVAPSVAFAKHFEKAGADAVICEGTEAGGHVGELTTMCITPQVVDSVNIPVVAAGGIGDGRVLRQPSA